MVGEQKDHRIRLAKHGTHTREAPYPVTLGNGAAERVTREGESHFEEVGTTQTEVRRVGSEDR
jgi:hypothetical protein